MTKVFLCIFLLLLYSATGNETSDKKATTIAPIAVVTVAAQNNKTNSTPVALKSDPSKETVKSTNLTKNSTTVAAKNDTSKGTVQPTKPKNGTKPGNNKQPTIEVTSLKPEVTSPYQKSTTHKNSRAIKCDGWCFKDDPSKSVVRVKANLTADKILIRKFAQLRSAVEKISDFPVKVGVNVFADKKQYKDVPINNRSRSHLFKKNVLNVPSMMFYPYTRRLIGKIVADSGQLFIPQKNERPYRVRASRTTGQGNRPLLRTEAFTFDNSYFERNPLIHRYTAVKKSRRRNFKKINFRKIYNKDIVHSNKDETTSYNNDYRRNDPINLKVADIDDFIFSANKGRAQTLKSRANHLQMLSGMSNEDTIVNQPGNDVDGIVGGMKIDDENAGTFLIGKTKDARSKLNNWLGSGSKGRSGKLPNEDGKGIIIKGKTRAKAIDGLLKSMVTNYQYGDKQFHYKAF